MRDICIQLSNALHHSLALAISFSIWVFQCLNYTFYPIGCMCCWTFLFDAFFILDFLSLMILLQTALVFVDIFWFDHNHQFDTTRYKYTFDCIISSFKRIHRSPCQMYFMVLFHFSKSIWNCPLSSISYQFISYFW